MADIQFQEDQEFSRRDIEASESIFIRLVYKTGLVSTKTQAEYVLVGFAIVAILCAFFISVKSFSTKSKILDKSIINSPQPMGQISR